MIQMTLFGPVVAERKCITCNEVKDLEKDFYPEYSSKAKHNEHYKKQCKACWNKFNGRVEFSNVAMFEVK